MIIYETIEQKQVREQNEQDCDDVGPRHWYRPDGSYEAIIYKLKGGK